MSRIGDVVEASLHLSGWMVENGRRVSGVDVVLPVQAEWTRTESGYALRPVEPMTWTLGPWERRVEIDHFSARWGSETGGVIYPLKLGDDVRGVAEGDTLTVVCPDPLARVWNDPE